jgi:hypothetical protein
VDVAFIGGLDIGQVQDPAAFTLLKREGKPPTGQYRVEALRRYAVGTRYHDMSADALAVMNTPPAAGWPLAVDQTGVGRPIVEDMRGKGVPIYPITITGGHNAHQDEQGWKVPKKDLIAVLMRLFQTQRLLISPALKFAALLVKELQNFRVKITAAANETFAAWREGDHDDLVFSVALAAWVGEKCLIGPWTVSEPGRRLEATRAPPGVFESDRLAAEFDLYDPEDDEEGEEGGYSAVRPPPW